MKTIQKILVEFKILISKWNPIIRCKWSEALEKINRLLNVVLLPKVIYENKFK